ncbi:MAG: hypothetical protein IPG91_19375 [Ideonella sp.]|nr:hypothetical protein [Ideonella sp.]
MDTKQGKQPQKISVKISRRIVESLDNKLEANCLRRDAYLNRVLQIETANLDLEVSMPNSQAARDYVAKGVAQMKSKPVSLALDPDLVARVNEVCERKRIVRDAFFNRLFLLLAASPAQIDDWLFGGEKHWLRDVWERYKGQSNFQDDFYPLWRSIDPFWAIHEGMEVQAKLCHQLEDWVPPGSEKPIRVERIGNMVRPVPGVYTVNLEPFFSNPGLNCHMTDWEVATTDAHKVYTREQEELSQLMKDI